MKELFPDLRFAIEQLRSEASKENPREEAAT
jgi:hypothetical protein